MEMATKEQKMVIVVQAMNHGVMKASEAHALLLRQRSGNSSKYQRSDKMIQALSHTNFPPSVPAGYDCGHSTMIGQDLCTSYRMRSSSNKAKALECFGQHANP